MDTHVCGDACRRSVLHLLAIPGLLLTLMLGAIGLTMYPLIRSALLRVWTLEEST